MRLFFIFAYRHNSYYTAPSGPMAITLPRSSSDAAMVGIQVKNNTKVQDRDYLLSSRCLESPCPRLSGNEHQHRGQQKQVAQKCEHNRQQRQEPKVSVDEKRGRGHNTESHSQHN